MNQFGVGKVESFLASVALGDIGRSTKSGWAQGFRLILLTRVMIWWRWLLLAVASSCEDGACEAPRAFIE